MSRRDPDAAYAAADAWCRSYDAAEAAAEKLLENRDEDGGCPVCGVELADLEAAVDHVDTWGCS